MNGIHSAKRHSKEKIAIVLNLENKVAHEEQECILFTITQTFHSKIGVKVPFSIKPSKLLHVVFRESKS